MGTKVAPLRGGVSKRRKKSSGWKARWTDRLDISRGKATAIQLCPGDYVDHTEREEVHKHYFTDFFHKVQHNGMFRYFRTNTPEECTLEARWRAADTRVDKPRPRYAMNVIHFDLYRKEDVRDRNGQDVLYKHGPNKGDVIRQWTPITSVKAVKQVKANIEELVAEGEVQMYRKRYVEVGPMHFDQLMQIPQKAKQFCRCGGRVEAIAYQCAHCDHVMLSADDGGDEDITVEELERYGQNERRCRKCGQYDYPKSIAECDSCDDPRPLNFWEVIALVRKQGADIPTLIVEDIIPIGDYQLPNGESPVEVDEEGDPLLDVEFKHGDSVEFTEGLKKLVVNGYDFEQVFEKKPNSEYSTFLELKEGDVGYERANRDYGSFRE